MEKLIDPADKIFEGISKLLDVEIVFLNTEENQNRLVPAFDVNAVISKFIALCVYRSMNVPSTFAPPYNRVHADVEYWKNKFLLTSNLENIQVPPEEVKGDSDGVSES